MNPNPDYKTILFRLIDKVKRTGDYYRRIARGLHRKAGHVEDPDEAARMLAQSESLDRCANDMEYAYSRATERLTREELDDLIQTTLPRDPTPA